MKDVVEWFLAAKTWGGMKPLDVIFGFGNGCFWTILIMFLFLDMHKLWEINTGKEEEVEEKKKVLLPEGKKKLSEYFKEQQWQ